MAKALRGDPFGGVFPKPKEDDSVNRAREFQSRESASQRAHELALQSAAFKQKTTFAQPFLNELKTGTGGDLATGELSESEKILVQAQEEAADKDVNRLQDVLSSAGILSSGQLTVGTGEILGSARGQIAESLATSAEGRLTRRHQQLLAKRQQLTDLIRSILV